MEIILELVEYSSMNMVVHIHNLIIPASGQWDPLTGLCRVYTLVSSVYNCISSFLCSGVEYVYEYCWNVVSHSTA